jgi:hypothetical protein
MLRTDHGVPFRIHHTGKPGRIDDSIHQRVAIRLCARLRQSGGIVVADLFGGARSRRPR